MRDHNHDFARKVRTLTVRCTRHHVNGLLILVAIMLMKIPINNGPEPPPTKNSVIESNIIIQAPYFLSMKTAAHIVNKRPAIIARIPVINKLGIIVKASKLALSHNL